MENRSRKILCVDSDPGSKLRLETLLRNVVDDFSLDFVADGREALAPIESKHFDLVVMDGWVPGLSGFKLCRHIKRMYPDLPVVLYCTAEHMNDRGFAAAAGADAFALKSEPAQEFAELLAQLLKPTRVAAQGPAHALRDSGL